SLAEGGTYPVSGLDRIDLSDSSFLAAGPPSVLAAGGVGAASGLVRTGGSVTFLLAGASSSLAVGAPYPVSGLATIDVSGASFLAAGPPSAFVAVLVTPLPTVGGSGVITVSRTI